MFERSTLERLPQSSAGLPPCRPGTAVSERSPTLEASVRDRARLSAFIFSSINNVLHNKIQTISFRAKPSMHIILKRARLLNKLVSMDFQLAQLVIETNCVPVQLLPYWPCAWTEGARDTLSKLAKLNRQKKLRFLRALIVAKRTNKQPIEISSARWTRIRPRCTSSSEAGSACGACAAPGAGHSRNAIVTPRSPPHLPWTSQVQGPSVDKPIDSAYDNRVQPHTAITPLQRKHLPHSSLAHRRSKEKRKSHSEAQRARGAVAARSMNDHNKYFDNKVACPRDESRPDIQHE